MSVLSCPPPPVEEVPSYTNEKLLTELTSMLEACSYPRWYREQYKTALIVELTKRLEKKEKE